MILFVLSFYRSQLIVQQISAVHQFTHHRGIPFPSPDQELAQILTLQGGLIAAPLLPYCPLNQQLLVFPPNHLWGKSQHLPCLLGQKYNGLHQRDDVNDTKNSCWSLLLENIFMIVLCVCVYKLYSLIIQTYPHCLC